MSDASNPERDRLFLAILEGDTDAIERALSAGADPNAHLATAMKWSDWVEDSVGPKMLYLAAISATAEHTVPLLLAAGADASRTWIYATDWDPDDCYLDTDEVTVLGALEALTTGEKDHFEVLIKDRTLGEKRIQELRKLGYFDADNNALYKAPTDAVLALIQSAVSND